MRSNSSIERGNPPPRRKSCAACVKAKRRCDLGVPRCSRCNLRDFECVYVGKPARKTQSPEPQSLAKSLPTHLTLNTTPSSVAAADSASTAGSSSRPDLQQSSYRNSAAPLPATSTFLDGGANYKTNDNPPMYGDRTPQVVQTLQSPIRLASFDLTTRDYAQYMDSLNKSGVKPLTPAPISVPTSASAPLSIPARSAATAQASSESIEAGLSEADVAMLDSMTKNASLQDFPNECLFNMDEIESFVASHMTTGTRFKDSESSSFPPSEQGTSPSSSLYQVPAVISMPIRWRPDERPCEMLYTRLAYAHQKIRDSPRTMVLTMETPWCHSQLYAGSMPRIMEDAMSSCALYMAKNESNSTVILRTIRSRLHCIVKSLVPASTQIEVLAKVQAILLYSIICASDSDINMMMAVDEAVPVLEQSAMDLLNMMIRDGLISESVQIDPLWTTFPVDTEEKFWRKWIFVESAQRTFNIVFLFAQVVRLLRDPMSFNLSVAGKKQLTHITVSAALWEARDVESFVKEWSRERHVVVNHFMIPQVLTNNTRADDLGTFEKMILMGLIGIDQYKLWAAEQGSVNID
ncbi:Transcription factor gsfR2 [Ceratocystis fimbriata CBS 114723]|uniref:Transcription factor gsfR2 n=1 Tax=Ceratocystis fimbriata CBS 114723 TaxID=1035309 RepID=A0A2C5WW41_9PEZI|nr:Transcription factor gsfR2 [Ceratocystis fimbriata CBS 114723]